MSGGKDEDGQRPNVDEGEQGWVFNVGRILQPLEEIIQHGQEFFALFTLGRGKEKHHDAVLQNPVDLSLCVEFILVPVVLHQHSVEEQVHHDGRVPVGEG